MINIFKAKILSELTPFKGCQLRNIDFKTENYSAFVGAILVIPQAITFAYLAGLPPEYGIYCAIFVTFFASMSGSSPMVGGPNTAVAILIGIAVLPLAGRGSPLYIDYVLILSLMVGIIQLIVWLLRGGHFFKYFSPQAITGITTGVGFLIMISSLDGLTGMSPTKTTLFYEKLILLSQNWNDLTNGYSFIIGMVTLVVGLVGKKFAPRYYIVMALLAGYLCGTLIHLIVPQVTTEVELLGKIPFTLLPLSFPPLDYDHIIVGFELFDSAVTIAFIGLAQSMVIVNDLKLQTRQPYDTNKEVFSQAFSNMLAPFFSSFAGSGSFNRTAVSISMGAKSPIASMLSSAWVAVIILLLGPLLSYLPMPSMAAILFLVGLGMVKPSKIKSHSLKRDDAIMLWTTLFCVVFLGLKVGIIIAIILSVSIFLSHTSNLEITDSIIDDCRIITIHGNCYYASLDQILPYFKEPERNLLINLEYVAYFDSSIAEFICKKQKSYANTQHQMALILPNPKFQTYIRQASTSQQNINIYSNFYQARTEFISSIK
ncbi:MAG: SulP family inorganic anion transporter [Methylococcales bacterium]|jgi:sulfate permease, SulP family|nr:SulP family inorganic anion transporter [Methylococcales bacterium]MBT7408292.1 SulP family inorganic anion transporter [Methylococcales bacterium]